MEIQNAHVTSGISVFQMRGHRGPGKSRRSHQAATKEAFLDLTVRKDWGEFNAEGARVDSAVLAGTDGLTGASSRTMPGQNAGHVFFIPRPLKYR